MLVFVLRCFNAGLNVARMVYDAGLSGIIGGWVFVSCQPAVTNNPRLQSVIPYLCSGVGAHRKDMVALHPLVQLVLFVKRTEDQ